MTDCPSFGQDRVHFYRGRGKHGLVLILFNTMSCHVRDRRKGARSGSKGLSPFQLREKNMVGEMVQYCFTFHVNYFFVICLFLLILLLFVLIFLMSLLFPVNYFYSNM